MSSRLLVSVTTVSEALDAEAGGADLIDIKQPLHGSLGMADRPTMDAIITAIDGRAPLSAALGEWEEGYEPPESLPRGSFIKWGPHGCAGDRASLAKWAESRKRYADHWQVVAVAYADADRAESPRPADLAVWAVEHRFSTFLIDTWSKDGSNLLDWLSEPELRAIRTLLSEHRIAFALAGSLGLREIKSLAHLAPEWFAVRGAACADGQRNGPIERARVETLSRLVHAN